MQWAKAAAVTDPGPKTHLPNPGPSAAELPRRQLISPTSAPYLSVVFSRLNLARADRFAGLNLATVGRTDVVAWFAQWVNSS